MGLNHVYKVIWNKTKGCYVVVSELAKRVGRNKAKAIVMATAAMAMVVTPAVMNVNQVEATVLIGSTNGTTISDNGSTVNTWGITIGGGITHAGEHSVHVGDATLEEGNRNVIIGTHATAGVDKIAGRHFVNQSVAIGGGNEPNLGARAFGDQSIAIGSNTISEGNSSIAIGNDDVDKAVGKQISYTNSNGKEVTDTLGSAYTDLTGKNLHTDGGQYADTRSGEAAVAIGVKAEAGDISLALGTGAKAKKVNTVSIGTGATADLDNSVAIGGGAVADESSQGTKQTSTTINGITYGWAGGDKTNKGDIVSFGKSGFERQLKNIAAGEISSTSTDAINGSQIHSLVEKITGTPKLSYTTKDGTPVYKLGDKFYKVNEKGQPISAAGKPAVGTNEDGKLVDADKNVIEPIDPAVTPLKNALVNPNPAAGKTGTTSPTALNNITSNLVNFDAPNVNGKVPAKNALRNLVNDAVSDDTVATVGDLRNMGWIVSADKTTGTDGTATDTAYSETVKNANEVKFVGKDGAIVSGATDAATGVRTITVGLDKKAMSGSGDSGSPVAYTKADGTKVYPVKAENGSVTYHTTPNGDGPNDAEVPKTEVITSVNGPEGTTTPAALTNVAGNLVGAKKDTNAPTTEQAAPTVGKGANEVNPNNAATVGDVLNAGWNLQENGTAKDFVKPYDTVNFINGANTTAVVTTSEDGSTSKVTYNVTGLPVTYTTEDGKPVSKVGDKFYKVNEQGQPVSEAGKPAVKTNDAGKLVDEDGTEIEPINPATTPLKNALVNPNPAADKTGTTSPTQLTNVEGNLVGSKTGTDTPTTEQAAPTVGKGANEVNPNNAATVGDVLNAGWNLQENGTAKDFVKPYDKVNFVNGGNTTAVVTTNAEGTVSNVSFNVTGLPVTYTTEDGKPVSKVGDKFYKVNEQGQPISEAGKPAVKTNDAGKLVDEDGTEIEPINPATTPLKNALVNPNPAVDKTGTTSPTALNNVTSGLNKYGDQVDGKPVEGTTPANTGLIDLSTPADGAAPKVSDNTAATVGDLRNMGWIVSADKTTGDLDKAYSATVKNANEVKFVGTGTAIVSGETKDGVRTITVNVDDQVSTNNATTPVVYTKADGTKVYPIKGENGAITYHTTPDGKGDNDQEVPGTEVITSVNSPDGTTTPATLANVAGNLDGAKKDTTAPKAEAAAPNTTNKDGDKYINPNNAATVGDVLNAGWNLQENGTAKDFVKPYDTVNFINGANTTAVVTTSEDGSTSKVTYNVTGLPVTYTTEDGKPVSKVGDKFYKVNEQGQPISEAGKPAVKTNDAGKLVDEDGTEIEPINPATTPLKNTLVNPNPAADKTGTTSPTQLTNVEGNLDGAKKDTTAPKAEAAAPNTTNKDGDKYINPNNAATVGDVLNAGWNLQENGTAKDFVKPYDTVNFINGANTTAVVTTSEDGSTSKVTYNVTGLPVTYTTEDGKPVSKVGDKFYKVNEQGQPVSEAGKPAVKTNDAGKLVDEDGTEIEPINPATTPLKNALVNPNPAADKTGTTTPTALNNVTSGLNKYGDQVDGKPVEGTTPANTGLIDLSTPADGAAPKVSDNTAATVGDLRNMGWIVSADKTTGDLDKAYSATVKNANEVKFVGTGTAIVSGETKDGVRTITVNVDDQVSANNAQTPVVYTDKEGKQVYPIKDEQGNVTYHTTPNGKGEGDKTVPNDEVNTSVNGPKDPTTGEVRPASLSNVKNNLPAVNDGDKKVTNADGTEKENPGDAGNINKAPLTAEKAADLLKPTTKDGKPNPNFVGNNAATVSDVLNAGWNLQNNGTAKDFVKPFDTVNFVNGGNTTAVVTTKADGTTSDVTFNVTGLPIATTITDPATGKQVPVVKVGDTFYPANPDGTPNIARNDKGEPTNGYVRANDGKLYPREAVTVTPAADPTKPPTVTPNTDAKPTTVNTNLANPNVDNTTNEPGNNVNTPTQLGNVANGANTFAPVAADGTAATDAKPAVKLANDGKWYPADQVEANGKPKADATPVANPLATKNADGDVLERGNDGNWYKASDLENGEPKPNVDEQTPVAKPANTEKAGLVNFENSNPNNAATVGDLQNLGFVVAAHDNGYTEQMRNANKVEFKGSNGVSVTGKTLEDGTREITVALKEGRVTNDVIITSADGTETHGVRGEDGKIYVKDPKTGKATKTEIQVALTDTVTNDGDAYVTGNSVATAIQKSGWNIGIGSTDKAFSEKAKTYERVNPKDNVKYVNGANTTVSMAVDAEKDRDGATVTTTYMKVDVNRDLNIDSVTTGGPAKDKDGNPLKLVDGKYYPENALVEDGKVYPAGTTFINGKPYPANTVMIDGKAYPAGSAKDPKTNAIVKDGQPATEVQPVTPLTATDVANVAPGKDGAMAVKDAKGNDGVSATAKDGKGTLTLNNADLDKDGKDGKNASQVNISAGKALADLDNTPKDAVRANDGKWYAPADVDVKTENGTTVVTPKAGKSPIADAPTMDRIQYKGTDGKLRDVATMDDGLRFQGDDGESISKPLNSTFTLTGGNREDTGKVVAKDATTTGNIGVFNTDGKLSVQLAKDLDKLNSANFESKTDKAGNPLKAVDGKYYPENSVVQEGKVYPEGTVIIDNKPYPAGTTKDAAGKVVNNGKPATEATPINPIDSKQVQDGPTSKLTGTGLTFNTPTPKDEKGNPLVLVDGKYYKADNLENGKPKADAKPEPVKPAQATAFTPDGLVVTPDTAKVVDPKTGEVKVDPNKVVSFGAPSIVTDPTTGKPVIDPKTGEPVMKSGISAGGQVMSNVAPGVLDTDAVNVSQLKGVANNINMRMDRMGAQAAAMAGLRHLQYDPLEPTTIMAGVGTYKGEGALALGIAHYKNESTLFHAGASIGSRGDELMANAGVSWKFGSRADETAVKDTFRQGPISASYTLQDKVSALEAQNQMQKDEINTLKAQLAEVLQYIKKG